MGAVAGLLSAEMSSAEVRSVSDRVRVRGDGDVARGRCPAPPALAPGPRHLGEWSWGGDPDLAPGVAAAIGRVGGVAGAVAGFGVPAAAPAGVAPAAARAGAAPAAAPIAVLPAAGSGRRFPASFPALRRGGAGQDGAPVHRRLQDALSGR